MSAGEPPSWGSGEYGDRPEGLGGGVAQEEKTWAVAAHLSAIVGAWIALGFIGPLVVLLLGTGRSAFARAHTVEALNFNLSILLYTFVGGLLVWLLGLGVPILIVVGILWLVGTILAAMKASRGEMYRYPLTIRLIH
jgi:uncharacterized Tic20 family protein